MRWLPLEANPDLLNSASSSLGLDTTTHSFHDIFSLDPDLLSFVPQPVDAVLLLFPISEVTERRRREVDDALPVVGGDGKGEGEGERLVDVYFRQRIGNACGTIALLHALGNVPNLSIREGTLTTLFSQCKNLSPEASADILESSSSVEQAHSEAAQSGQSAVPRLEDDVDLHFVAFVKSQRTGELVELDGRRKGPVSHGPIPEGSDLLSAIVPVVKKLMDESGTINFNMVALGPGVQD